MARSRSRGRRRAARDHSPAPRHGRRRRHRRPAEPASPSASPSRSRSAERNPLETKKDAKWVCATCAGPHRTKDCPLAMGQGLGSGSGPMNPAQIGTMMGFAAGPMGMRMGMPPMGMPMPGMPGMPPFPGMPGMPGMPPMGMMPPMVPMPEDEKKKGKGIDSSDSGSDSGSESQPRAPARRQRSKSRGKRGTRDRGDRGDRGGDRGEPRERERERSPPREPVKIEEVEKFIEENRINEEASLKIRAMSPNSQRRVIARPLTGDVQNPSKVMIARVRELQSQNERMKGGTDIWSAWGSAMMGATPEAINKYIRDNDLDESASGQLRSLPPHQQAIALRWDLSGYRNPSAKFMSMANGLAITGPKIAMPPMMMGMPPPMMMGMPPMGMPGMPGMPPMGMPPGMAPGKSSSRARSGSQDSSF